MRITSSFLVVLSGLAAGASFLVPLGWFMPCIVLAPALYVLAHESTRQRTMLGFVLGLCLFGCAMYPIFWDALPLSWVVDSALPVQIAFIGAGWLLTIGAAAIPFAFFAYLLPRFSFNDYRDYLTIPSLFVLCECLGTSLISFLMSGDGSILGPHVGMGFIGSTIVENIPLLQLSALGGVYALSFFVIAANVSLLKCIRGRSANDITPFVIGMAFIAIGAFVFPPPDSAAGSFRVSALSTNIPPLRGLTSGTTDRYYADIMAHVGRVPPSDVLLLPENLDLLTYAKKHSITLAASGSPAIIDSGSTPASPATSIRRVTYYDTKRGAQAFSYKRFLVPFGEYMPNLFRPLASVSDAVRTLARDRNFVSGPKSPPILIHAIPTATLSCNEVFSPELYRESVRDGAQVLFNIAAHSWYDGSEKVYLQALRASRIRAAENQRPLIASNNLARAYALDRFGRVQAESALGGTVTALAQPSSTLTPYTRFGSQVLLFPFGILVVALLTRVRRR